MRTRTTGWATVVVSAAFALTACSGGSSNSASSAPPTSAGSPSASTDTSTPVASPSSSSPAPDAGKPVKLTWWHNGTEDPLKQYWADEAAAFTKLHPNVTFDVVPIQNETIQKKINLALQGTPPDIFQQWGGGDEATQQQSGKLMDLTPILGDEIKALGGTAAGWQVEGKQFGVPWNMGIVGFWYRTDLFTSAGISGPPATIDDLYKDIDLLKAKGIAPIAVGGKDKWPDAFYYGYFATRECATDVLKNATLKKDFSDPCFAKAGKDIQDLVAKQPFQKGFLGSPAQQGAVSSAGLVANGKAAMELQGQWDGAVITGLTPDKKSLGDKLAWFPFPTVTGGAGDPSAQFGGGDGFSCSASAPPECALFLKFILSPDEQKKFATTGAGLPSIPDAGSAVTDKAMAPVLKARDGASFIELYFDKALPTAVGSALNDEVANIFAGSGSPDAIVKAVADAAAANK